jgi:hypothetical protein
MSGLPLMVKLQRGDIPPTVCCMLRVYLGWVEGTSSKMLSVCLHDQSTSYQTRQPIYIYSHFTIMVVSLLILLLAACALAAKHPAYNVTDPPPKNGFLSALDGLSGCQVGLLFRSRPILARIPRLLSHLLLPLSS